MTCFIIFLKSLSSHHRSHVTPNIMKFVSKLLYSLDNNLVSESRQLPGKWVSHAENDSQIIQKMSFGT